MTQFPGMPGRLYLISEGNYPGFQTPIGVLRFAYLPLPSPPTLTTLTALEITHLKVFKAVKAFSPLLVV